MDKTVCLKITERTHKNLIELEEKYKKAFPEYKKLYTHDFIISEAIEELNKKKPRMNNRGLCYG